MYLRISVVTTNFNGAAYLERAMRSVLDQGYPALDYIVIDGGSTDGSQKIIERYEKHLSYWESAADRGFAHAYNKGFSRATGEVFAYLNSDDAYCTSAFNIVNRVLHDLPQIEWLTSLFPVCHSPHLDFVSVVPAQPFNAELYRAGFYGTKLQGIQQESTFWRRDLWHKAGGHFDESLKMAIDAELWARFFEHAELYAVATLLGGFRVRPDSKSGADARGYYDEMESVLRRSTLRRRQRSPAVRAYELAHRSKLARFMLQSAFRSGLIRVPFVGKTVHWDHDAGNFVARDSAITV